MKRRVYSLLVDNTSGVLGRVAGMFSRRGYNIDSLTVGETTNPKFSRMTVSASGDNAALDQITKQLGKLIEVRDIKVLKPEESVLGEIMMVKIRCDADKRQQAITIAELFKGKIADVSPDSIIIVVTGNMGKLDAFLKLMEDFQVLELARTGITGLSRGSEQVEPNDLKRLFL